MNDLVKRAAAFASGVTMLLVFASCEKPGISSPENTASVINSSSTVSEKPDESSHADKTDSTTESPEANSTTEPPETDGTSKPQATNSTTEPPTTENVITPSLPKEEKLFAAGISLDRFFSYSGSFVEDGSDEPVENIAAVTVTNNTDKAWQLIKFELSAGSEHYSFTATAFMPGMTLTLLETDKKPFVMNAEEEVFTVAQSGEYGTKCEKYEDLFHADIYDSIINLTNTANRDFESNIYVYYKNKGADGHPCGITYRVNMGALKKGGMSQRYSEHLSETDSEIIFITYDK